MNLRPIRRLGAAIAMVALAGGGMVSAATSAFASGRTALGCPSGATCLYRPGGIGASSPAYVFTSYGYHNLSGMTGEGALVENQTGTASIGTYWCSGYGGTGTLLGAASGPNTTYGYSVRDPLYLTPINSVILTRHYSAANPPASCNSVVY